jgi:cobalt transporter subunit CbtB
MSTTPDTVASRIEAVRMELTAAQAVGLALLLTVGAALLFSGDPAVHDAAHDLRHAAGIVCH